MTPNERMDLIRRGYQIAAEIERRELLERKPVVIPEQFWKYVR